MSTNTPITPVTPVTPVTPGAAAEEAVGILDLINEKTPGFVVRSGQQAMTRAIAENLAVLASVDVGDDDSDETKLAAARRAAPVVIEAGTGTGKSLGYLSSVVPAALRTGRRVLISTGTVAMQEQLVNRDIPLFLEKTGLHASVALAKGRGRYACSVKMNDIIGGTDGGQAEMEGMGFDRPDPEPTNDATEEAVRRMAAAYKRGHWDGDLDSWPEPVTSEIRSQVVMPRAGCMKSNCPKFNECAFYQSRKRLEDADIVVTNHHLTLADLRIGDGGVVTRCPPESTIFVFDEAHHLEHVAKTFLERHLSTKEFNLFVASVSSRLPDILTHLGAIERHSWDPNKMDDLLRGARELVSDITENFRWATQSVDDKGGILRYEHGRLPEALLSSVQELRTYTQRIDKMLNDLAEIAKDRVKGMGEFQASEINESLGLLLTQSEDIDHALYLLGWEDKKNTVPFARWVQRNIYGDEEDFSLNVAPTRVGHSLSKLLWGRASAVVLTSATLSSLGSFQKMARDTGLQHYPETRYEKVASPFDYASNALFHIPMMRLQPQGKNVDAFYDEVVEKLPDLIDNQPVGTLVLFTSKRAMTQTALAVPKSLRQHLLCQGDLSKSELIRTHQQRIAGGEASIIFGLASFSEGIDLPGDLCRHVIVTRLSFQPPNDPVTETISEYLEDRHLSAFEHLMLPEASKRLVQATGRLLRSESDSGRITVLDRRLVTKRYGQRMRSDLPGYTYQIDGVGAKSNGARSTAARGQANGNPNGNRGGLFNRGGAQREAACV